jgi:hypoxanthine phosphoribosyltransferase
MRRPLIARTHAMPPLAPSALSVPPTGLPAEPSEQALHDRLLADPRIAEVLVPRSRLNDRIEVLAAAIAADYGAQTVLTLVIVLKGAVCFATDLGEAICRLDGPALRYEFVRASTYGLGIKAAGEEDRAVRITLAPQDLAGCDVLLVEDLVDQGFTLSQLARHLREETGLRSLRTCVLAAKALAAPTAAVQRLRAALALDYVGFHLPDRWIAGYGIDAGEDFRNLPCIVAVNEEHYRP